MVGLFFPFLLIISATLYAFKTRKCPGGFNETRPVLYCAYTFSVVID
jgi:metabotropic X receptor